MCCLSFLHLLQRVTLNSYTAHNTTALLYLHTGIMEARGTRWHDRAHFFIEWSAHGHPRNQKFRKFGYKAALCYLLLMAMQRVHELPSLWLWGLPQSIGLMVGEKMV